MTSNAIFVLAFAVGAAAVVIVSFEAGYRIGLLKHRAGIRLELLPVATIANTIVALLTFILAFTFDIAATRFDTRINLVSDEANKIRTAWARSDLLPNPDRSEFRELLGKYVHERISAVQTPRIGALIPRAEDIQNRLWMIATNNMRKDATSASLYAQAINAMAEVHASRVLVGLQMQIPAGVWIALGGLMILGMSAMGQQWGLAGSRPTAGVILMATAFGLVVGMIAVLDRPMAGLTVVPQQPLIDLLGTMEAPPSPVQP